MKLIKRATVGYCKGRGISWEMYEVMRAIGRGFVVFVDSSIIHAHQIHALHSDVLFCPARAAVFIFVL